ncbi:hypothetical protein FMGBMHLM_3974 [Methylobacterium aerolatum]|nr:hypothetical protein FMGBMHLM_3974 [Methylobacterium aerolatum]
MVAHRYRAEPLRLVWGEPVSSLVRILLAIVFPPIAVLVTTGFGIQFLLNIVLWILGWLPGTVHALWLMNRDRPLV